MTHDARITLTGWIGSTPRLFPATDDAVAYMSMRVAHRKSWYHRSKGEWVDGPTTWYTVKAWRALAENVAASLRKGDPVMICGNLTNDTWESPDGERETMVIEADAIGPHLGRGRCVFTPMRASEPSDTTQNMNASNTSEDATTTATGTHQSQPATASADVTQSLTDRSASTDALTAV